MKVQSLQIGQPAANLEILKTNKLTKYSSIKLVATENVVNLLKENAALAPSSFERFRARSIGILVGAALPLIIGGIFGAVIYGLYREGTLAILYVKAYAVVSALAAKVFAAMTSSNTTIAASTGGAFAATVLLTRPGVYEAIGSFVGSSLGSFTGSGLVAFIKDTQQAGYNWWYDKYQFKQREQSILNNHASIVNLLSDAYNDMALELKETLNRPKQTPKEIEQLKAGATILKKHIPIIHAIFEKHDIQKPEETTLQLEKAIGKVLSTPSPKR